MPEIEVFLRMNLSFTVSVITWDLPNDENMCKKEYSVQFDQ